LFCTFTPVLKPELLNGMIEVSRHLATMSWTKMLFAGISSGFLIAAMVWMIPAAESAKFAVIALMTYVIAVGGFTHIVTGSMEAYILVFAGEWQWWQMIGEFAVPVLMLAAQRAVLAGFTAARPCPRQRRQVWQQTTGFRHIDRRRRLRVGLLDRRRRPRALHMLLRAARRLVFRRQPRLGWLRLPCTRLRPHDGVGIVDGLGMRGQRRHQRGDQRTDDKQTSHALKMGMQSPGR
jgi:hypothetical protein